MSQKQQRSAQRRAEKRHRREVERRQVRAEARKRSITTKERRDEDDSDPMLSADEETVVHPYLTQRTRERDLDARRDPRRWQRAMPGFSTHAEVAALADDALFTALAERGLVLTPADVLAHIARMPAGGSAWRMSRIYWLPALAARDLSAADRDFLGLAAVELWRRLRRDDPPLESLLALLADTDDLRAGNDTREYLTSLVRFLAAARARIDPRSPDEIAGVSLPLPDLLSRTLINTARLASKCPELASDALAEAERWSGMRFADETLADRLFAQQMLILACEALGRHAHAEQILRAALAEDPDDPVAAKMLAIHLHAHPDGDRARLVEALARWDSVRPPDDHPNLAIHQKTLDEIAESLRLLDNAAAAASP